jgi:hypothetical protein
MLLTLRKFAAEQNRFKKGNPEEGHWAIIFSGTLKFH